MEHNFFLNSNSSKGFYSYYNELDNERYTNVYSILGAPGTGKSTFIKEKCGEIYDNDTEKIYCSSDISSLDAVIFNENKIIYADSTSPHTLNIKYPIIRDNIIDLYQFLDKNKIKGDIFSIIDKKQFHYNKAYKLLHLAGEIKKSIKEENSQDIDKTKIKRSARNYVYKNIIPFSSDDFITKKRFLSSISAEGIKTFYDSIEKNYEKIFIYEDNLETENYFIKEIEAFLSEQKISHIKCYCALEPDNIEHILIPDKKTAYLFCYNYHTYQGKYYRKINVKRFFKTSPIQTNKIKFNKKIEMLFIKKASEHLKEAKHLHQELEKIYNSAMDFSKMKKSSEI